MVNKEYWNVSDAKKKYLQKYLVLVVFYISAVSALCLARPGDLLLLAVSAGGGIWVAHDIVMKTRRMASHPLCRLSDEFLTLDYDRRMIPWNIVSGVIWRWKKHETVVFYRIRPKREYTTLTLLNEKPVFIDRRWMKDEETFFNDLKAVCDERSIEFLVTEKGFGAR